MSGPSEEARQLAEVAEDLEERGYAYVGAIRRAARRLTELEAQAADRGADTEDGCRGCGGPLTGRQRTWCSEACRSRARRR